ncbi:hypothetical protein [Pseudaestuariivita rosea]|uniref:hypothetical protein n=1 Tax=Pseudaestuariivita rosea TaxID=2763263 RepID=UPI001ABB9037|nr:hypothetical protein [Pseudaestuariivita rosea]
MSPISDMIRKDKVLEIDLADANNTETGIANPQPDLDERMDRFLASIDDPQSDQFAFL